MNTNLQLSLHDLRAHHPRNHDLITQLLHIQSTYLLHNLKSLTWITNLQCLSTHNPLARKRKHGAAGPSTSTAQTLTRTTVNGRTGAYIAISYPWEASTAAHTLDAPATGAWRIRSSPSSRAHATSAVRDAVLARAAACAAALGCPNVWIDRECVPQEAGPENEAALHTMDLVYQFSDWPVALLFAPLRDAADLCAFASVMGRELLARRRRGLAGDELREGVDVGDVRGALGVLERVTADPWWERAWTFQENYCAGPKMNLLIPLADGRLWRKRRQGEAWRTGDVPGELLVSSVEFHKAATRFCLAFLRSSFISDAEKETCWTVIRKAGRYSFTILHDGTAGAWDYSRTMTTRILEDIAHRNARFRADLLPIASNCCQYGARLDTSQLYDSNEHLSVCILALWLLNGEIFKSEVSHVPSELAKMSIFEYLKAISLDNFAPPVKDGQLTFLKTCRFVDVQLSEYGVTTSGWLWSVDRQISTRDFKLRSQKLKSKDKADHEDPDPAQPPLKILADELRSRGYHKIAELLKRNKYFQKNKEKKHSSDVEGSSPTPAEAYMRIAARNLERAVIKDSPLLLGRLWDAQSEEEDDSSLPPHTAIFIGKREAQEVSKASELNGHELVGGHRGCASESCSGSSESPAPEKEAAPQSFVPTYAFTAWSGRSDDVDRNVEESLIDKYVSLEVSVDEQRANGIPLLKTKRWVNGLCFFGREAEMDVTFAWPPGLSNIMENETGAG